MGNLLHYNVNSVYSNASAIQNMNIEEVYISVHNTIDI